MESNKKYLGEILVQRGLVSMRKVEEALAKQRESRRCRQLPEKIARSRLVSEARLAAEAHQHSQLGNLLVDMGLVNQNDIDKALDEQEQYLAAFSNLDSRKLAAVMEIGQVVNSTLNLSEVLQLIMNFSNQVTDSVASTLFLVDLETSELVFSVPTGPASEDLVDYRLPPGEGIAGWVAQQKTPLLVSDAQNDPRFFKGIDDKTGFVTHTVLAVPLMAQGKLIGVLEVVNKKSGGPFTREDERFLSVFGSQAALALENARLYREMKEKYDQEIAIQQKLSENEKLKALGLMASGISHNFNNLLTVILGNTELMENQGCDPTLARKVAAIKRAALDGAAIVNRILAFSKSQEGQDRLASVSMNQVVRDSVHMTEPIWKGKALSDGVNLEVEYIPCLGDPKVEGSEGALKEVMVNLLFNAVDAMPHGGRIQVDCRNLGDAVSIIVVDQGVGIPPEAVKRVFDPFYSTKGVGHTGLGLSTVYGIVKSHHGDLRIDSVAGNGTTVTLTLPCRQHTVEEQEPKPAPPPLKTLRVLVVDDDEPVGAYVKEMLEAKGHRAVYAERGQTALGLMQTQAFDLLITDLVMPKMSGWELIEKAKAMNPALKIGLITGWDVQKAEIEERHVDFMIKKPFKMSDLIQAVNRAVAEE